MISITTYKEVWVDIKGYEGLYQISTMGNVKSLSRQVKHSNGGLKVLKERMLKTRVNSTTGYREVGLSKDGKQKFHHIHKLVAEAFIDNPHRLPVVNHIDGCKTNNDISNLEWVTCSENIRHALTNGLSKNNMTDEISRLGNEAHRKQVKCIEDDLVFDSVREAASYYGLQISNISRVCNGKLKTTGGKHFEFHIERTDA